VKPARAGEAVSYGHRHRLTHDTVLATLPIGYADGVFRPLGVAGQEVLIGGRRCPMVGVVTMDQLMVDCGPDATVRPGDPVVLLGRQGDERVTPDEWAERLGTINYEVVCAIGPRVARRYQG
jgi:alanine racemase